MTKEEIKQYIETNCIHPNGKWNAAKLSERSLKFRGLYDDIMSLYPDATCIHEIIYRLLNGIDERPVCKGCGKFVKYSKQFGFSTFCSPACRNKDPEVLAKNKAGVSKALKAAYAERGDEINRKRAKALTGDENGTCSPFGVKKWQDKAKATVLKRYGVDNVFRLEKFRGNARERSRTYSIKIWKSRGIDVEYIDNTYVKLLNACPVHGDVTLTIKSLHAKIKRCPKLPNGGYDIKFLCKECYPAYMTNVERFVASILDEAGIEYIFRDRQVIKPYELDFWIPSLKLAIECNGIYWHSVDKTEESYHLDKYNMVRNSGKIRNYISVWEDDCINHSTLMTALIKSHIFGYKTEYWLDVYIDDVVQSSLNMIKFADDSMLPYDGLYRLHHIDNGVFLEFGKDAVIQPIFYKGLDLPEFTDSFRYGFINLDLTMDYADMNKIIRIETDHMWDGEPHQCLHTGLVIHEDLNNTDFTGKLNMYQCSCDFNEELVDELVKLGYTKEDSFNSNGIFMYLQNGRIGTAGEFEEVPIRTRKLYCGPSYEIMLRIAAINSADNIGQLVKNSAGDIMVNETSEIMDGCVKLTLDEVIEYFCADNVEESDDIE